MPGSNTCALSKTIAQDMVLIINAMGEGGKGEGMGFVVGEQGASAL